MTGSYPPVQDGQWRYPSPPPPPPGGYWGYPPPPRPGYRWPPPPPPPRPHPARWAIIGLVVAMFVAFSATVLTYAVTRPPDTQWNTGAGGAAAPNPPLNPSVVPGDPSSI